MQTRNNKRLSLMKHINEKYYFAIPLWGLSTLTLKNFFYLLCLVTAFHATFRLTFRIFDQRCSEMAFFLFKLLCHNPPFQVPSMVSFLLQYHFISRNNNFIWFKLGFCCGLQYYIQIIKGIMLVYLNVFVYIVDLR